MMRQDDFLSQLADTMAILGMTREVPIEIVVGGSSVYEIEGAGTKIAAQRGTVKYNKDAFIVIRKVTPVVSSKLQNLEGE